MAKKRAFITGITGQDGSYLAELLLDKGYDVYGLARRSSNDPFTRIHHLSTPRRITIFYGDLRDSGALSRALEEARPDEVYNLAAQSDVGISFKVPEETFEINYYGLGRLINEAVKVNPNVRIYQASTSEMFGKTKPQQDENSPFQPVSPYGEAKLKAHEDFVQGYRNRHGLFICSGILFNHESPRRGEHFVTRKITLSLAKIKHGLQKRLELGNLEARRDWGFAGDYVEAMWRMLQQEKADDYVIATGKSHTVHEFVDHAAAIVGMPITWEGKGEKEVGNDASGAIIVSINPIFYRPTEVDYLEGNAGKAKKTFGWEPKTSFKQLVEMMVKKDIERAANTRGFL